MYQQYMDFVHACEACFILAFVAVMFIWDRTH